MSYTSPTPIAYVPYTGALLPVDLGAQNFTTIGTVFGGSGSKFGTATEYWTIGTISIGFPFPTNFPTLTPTDPATGFTGVIVGGLNIDPGASAFTSFVLLDDSQNGPGWTFMNDFDSTRGHGAGVLVISDFGQLGSEIWTDADITIGADSTKLAIGAAGVVDSYLQWDGSGLDRFSSGGIFNYQAAANTDITLNFEGTTNSGVYKWLEDEDRFEFGDNVQLGTATTQIHGINTAPVANQMLTADFTNSEAAPFFIDGTMASTGNAGKVVRGYSLVFDISGTINAVHNSVVDGVYIKINDNTIYNHVAAESNHVGFRSDITFSGTDTASNFLHYTGGYFSADGALGASSGTVHYGIQAIASDSAEINYGGYFSATGATTNWGIFNDAGNVFLGDDNEKTMWGTTNTDLQIYSDGTNGVFDLTGALYIRPSGDTDNYFSLSTAGGAPTIGTVGSCNLKLTASSGIIEADDDIALANAEFFILDKASGNGIKVDTATPTFPWHDLTGTIVVKVTGAGRPSFVTYKGNIEEYQFAVNDKVEFTYHIPHNYVSGSDIHLHVHWSHISAAVTGGTITFGYELTYAKGHDQAPFGANKTGTIVGTASTTQYQHVISEIQISAASPSGSQIDSDDLEPDGLILIELFLNANDMTGATPDPFVHEMDIHYQSTSIGTKQKAPDFYV